MTVIATKPSRIPGSQFLRRAYLQWLLDHAEADAAAYEKQAKVARDEAQRLRVELSLLNAAR